MGNNLLKILNPVQNCDIFYPEILSAAIILLILVLYKDIIFFSKKGRAAVILLAGGGLANLAERVVTGCVWDYFAFFGLFSFNLSDLMVTLGSGLLIYGIWEKKN